jgi:biotin carboxyl carrier protein
MAHLDHTEHIVTASWRADELRLGAEDGTTSYRIAGDGDAIILDVQGQWATSPEPRAAATDTPPAVLGPESGGDPVADAVPAIQPRSAVPLIPTSAGHVLLFTTAPAPSDAMQAIAGPHRLGLHVPMPGIVAKVHVQEGERVAEHQPLLVLEAMKMEHVIAAPHAGIVKRLPYALGALAPAHAVLVEMEEI